METVPRIKNISAKAMGAMRKHKIISIIAAVGVIYGGYYAYGKLTASPVATRYVTAQARKGTLVVSVSGSGQVAASNQVNITSKASGNTAEVAVRDGERVHAGQLLVAFDAAADERALRNASASLANAQLALQNLLAPPATTTLLQDQGSVYQAEQSYTTAVNNLSTDYANAYTDISNTFIDMPAVMTGLNTVLYGTAINKNQADIDAYANMVSRYDPAIMDYDSSAAASYATALADYNKNLTDYKNSNIYSSTSTVETLLAESYNTLKAISVSESDAKNLIDRVNNDLTQNQQKVPAQLTTDETSLQSYITTTNSHISTLFQRLNSLASDKQAIVTAQLSEKQAQAALDQLNAGATELQIEQEKLAVTQAENSYTDAEDALANDYAYALFSGVVTNVAAKVGEPAPGTIAVLVSDSQIAQATFNETDIVNVKVGEKATVTFDALPDTTLTGTVSEVDTLGTVSQGVVSYNVQVALDVPNASIKPGMSDTVNVITKVDQDVIMVPNSAVKTVQGISTVQVLDASGIPHTAQVTIGGANDKETQITSGLNEGDAVVTQTISGASITAAPAGGVAGGNRGFGGGGGAIFHLGG